MLTIRKVRMNDAEAMTHIMSELGYRTSLENMVARMERIASDPAHCTFVADLDGEVVGMIHLRTVLSYLNDNVSAQVSTLITKSEFRGKGVGTELMYSGEQWAKEQGAQSLLLNSGIKKDREDAHQFYENRGFSITGYRFSKSFL